MKMPNMYKDWARVTFQFSPQTKLNWKSQNFTSEMYEIYVVNNMAVWVLEFETRGFLLEQWMATKWVEPIYLFFAQFE